MTRQPKYRFPGEAALAAAPQDHADIMREFREMNKAANRSAARNAKVIADGAIRNALGGIVPFVNDHPQRRRRR